MKKGHFRTNLFLTGIVCAVFVCAPMTSLAASAPVSILPSTVPIVVYHSVSMGYETASTKNKEYYVEPAMFEKQLQYLQQKGYDVISFGTLVDHLTKSAPFQKKSIVLTFDDGVENQYQNAFPLLKKYGVTATFFIYTNPIGRSKNFMTWDQIKALQAAGMTIGDHTMHHPFLQKITDPKILNDEIVGSKNILEKELGTKITFFAYPFYQTSPAAIALLKSSGYTAARSGYTSVPNSANTLFDLRAVEANNDFTDFSTRFK